MFQVTMLQNKAQSVVIIGVCIVHAGNMKAFPAYFHASLTGLVRHNQT